MPTERTAAKVTSGRTADAARGSVHSGSVRPNKGHASGETTGSPHRPAQHMTGASLAFDLGAVGRSLREEAIWQRGDRNAQTLVKEPALRVVLTVLKRGARIQGHEVGAPFTLQCVGGRLRVQLPTGAHELVEGHLLSVGPDVTHDVEAIEESAFLLTVSASRLGTPGSDAPD